MSFHAILASARTPALLDKHQQTPYYTGLFHSIIINVYLIHNESKITQLHSTYGMQKYGPPFLKEKKEKYQKFQRSFSDCFFFTAPVRMITEGPRRDNT